MRILLLENDKTIGDRIVHGLKLDNYAIDRVESKSSAITALSCNAYELLVLDLDVPDDSNMNILTILCDKKNNIPVLILSANNDISYKIKVLDGGADDYLVKPFDLDELRARIRALGRRANGNSTPTLTIDSIVLNPATHKVTQNGSTVNLGPKEFAVLQTLMEKPGRILSKTQIEDSLYGWDMEIESNTIEVHIHGIRKKLGKECIQTVRHVGYKARDTPSSKKNSVMLFSDNLLGNDTRSGPLQLP